MRSLLVALCLLGGLLVSAPARAGTGTILVMTERNAELGAALEVALANRRVDVARMDSPNGRLRLDRAASAQRAALDAGADAAVWIDLDGTTDVCAVSSDGRVFRFAPINDVSPRMFAAVATSLLDELLAPPELSVHVDVNVTINGTATPVVTATPTPTPSNVGGPSTRMALADPQFELQDVGPPRPWRPRAHRTIFEVGPMVAPLAVGVEADLMFPLTSTWRLGVMGIAGVLPDDDYAGIYAAALEMRYVAGRKLDMGVFGGAATALGDPVTLLGFRFNIAWEGESHNKALSIAPVLIFPGTSDKILPGIFASLRWGVPL